MSVIMLSFPDTEADLQVEWVHDAWRDIKQARCKHVEGLKKLLSR